MGPERVTFVTTLPLGRGDQPEAGPVHAVADARIQAEPHDRSRAAVAALTSGLSYTCRYCGRAHYPTCR
jgi:hypothetical protein